MPSDDDKSFTLNKRFSVDVPQAHDPSNTTADVDSYFRIGSPLDRVDNAPTHEDSLATSIWSAAETAPDKTADQVNVKRALQFSNAAGFAFLTQGRFLKYLNGNDDTRIADGSFLVNVVDQPPAPASNSTTTNSSSSTPSKLSYLRLGKAEAQLYDTDGTTKLPKLYDRLKDVKYDSGIGMYTDGTTNVLSKGAISFRSSTAFFINARSFSVTSYGERFNISYYIPNPDDVDKINDGQVDDQDVTRSYQNINWLRHTPIGWYTQVFDRTRALNFSLANTGSFSIGSAYTLGIGAKFDHSVSANLVTSLSGTVKFEKAFAIELGHGLPTVKGPSGEFNEDYEKLLRADASLLLSVSDVTDVPWRTGIKAAEIAMEVAVLAQTTAFTLYDAVLAGEADQKLTSADIEVPLELENSRFRSSFDAGITVYETALSLSAVTAALGILIYAVQKLRARAQVQLPVTPSIEITKTGITLKSGACSIAMTSTGITISGGLNVMVGAGTITLSASSVGHGPLFLIPPPPPRPPPPPPPQN